MYFLPVNLDANRVCKCAYSLQQVLGVVQQLRFVGAHALQLADLLALGGHLFGEHLHLQRERLLVGLQATQPLVGVLALTCAGNETKQIQEHLAPFYGRLGGGHFYYTVLKHAHTHIDTFRFDLKWVKRCYTRTSK